MGERSLRGGADEATAFTTVVREIPNRLAITDFDTPSAASRRIKAQSSKVITPQWSSIHFSPSKLSSFRSSSTVTSADPREASPELTLSVHDADVKDTACPAERRTTDEFRGG